MLLTGKHVGRRTILRGVGAAIALPFLDAMVPAMRRQRLTAAAPFFRLGIHYVPNGMMMADWTPRTEGTGFQLTPILESLAPFREQTVVITGCDNKNGWALPGEGTGDHARAPASFLSGVHVKKTEGADLNAGVTIDQIAARELGKETQLSSLELGLESVEMMGACDGGYSCAYSNTISWRTATTPLPMEADPRAVFERLFGASTSTDVTVRLEQIRKERSILDSVSDKIAQLEGQLPAGDRVKLTEYLDAIRDAERRIQKAEEQSRRELPVVERPGAIPATFDDQAKLMFDLLTLAYQCDLTRVSTFMMAREVSNRAYPEHGVHDAHHDTSHHQNDPVKLAKLSVINKAHMRAFAYFVGRLRATADVDGTLLDHTILLYGAGISDSNTHVHDNCPLLVISGGAIKGGRHVRVPKGTPVMNLHLTLLDKIGVNVDQLGDSTGRLKELSEI